MSTGLPVADYSFGRPADYAELARQVAGVVRYVSNSYENPKNITAAEAQLLAAHGVPLGITWENEANSMLGGYAYGRVAAQWSVSITRKAGIPDGVTYYAADQDFTLGGPPVSTRALANCHAVADFLSGAASITGWDQVGCYGSLYLLQWLRANTPLQHGWMTAAWSGGRFANWRWTGNVDPIAGIVQDEFWSDQHPITVSGCPVDFSTVLGDWHPRTATMNGELSMADAASLASEIQNLATLLDARLTRIDKMQQFTITAESARFDALAAALQVMHGAVVDGAEGNPVDFTAMAKLLEGAQVTLAKIQEGAPA